MLFRKKKSRPEIWTFNDLTRLYAAAAAMIRELAKLAVSRRGRFAVALAGGEVYRPLYETLALGSAHTALSWPAIELFWTEEVCSPSELAGCNHRLALDTLLARAPVPETNIHRIEAELGAEAAAEAYALNLGDAFGTPPGADDKPPIFDLILLRAGSDGRAVGPPSGQNNAPAAQAWTVTTPGAGPVLPRAWLGLNVLNHARTLLCVAVGTQIRPVPLEGLEAHGRQVWFVADAAGS